MLLGCGLQLTRGKEEAGVQAPGRSAGQRQLTVCAQDFEPALRQPLREVDVVAVAAAAARAPALGVACGRCGAAARRAGCVSARVRKAAAGAGARAANHTSMQTDSAVYTQRCTRLLECCLFFTACSLTGVDVEVKHLGLCAALARDAREHADRLARAEAAAHVVVDLQHPPNLTWVRHGCCCAAATGAAAAGWRGVGPAGVAVAVRGASAGEQQQRTQRASAAGGVRHAAVAPPDAAAVLEALTAASLS